MFRKTIVRATVRAVWLLVLGAASIPAHAEPRFLTLPFSNANIYVGQGWLYDSPGPFDCPELGTALENRCHKGIDYFLGNQSSGTPFDVLAAAPGKAVATLSLSYGYLVYVAHNEVDSSGLLIFTLYAHLKQGSWAVPFNITFKTLDQMKTDIANRNFVGWRDVKRGDKIGTTGDSGESTSIHLHFEVQRGGYPLNKTDPYDIYNTRTFYPGPCQPSGPAAIPQPDPGFLWTQCPPVPPQPLASLSFSRSDLAMTDQPIYVALTDLNRDAKLDLLVAMPNGNAVLRLLGNGDGTFRNIGALSYPGEAVAVGDFDGDGNADVAVATFFFGGQIQTFRGNGDGTFASGQVLQTGGGIPTWMSAIDINRDGHLDLIVASEFPDHISVFLGDGRGNFTLKSNFVPGAAPQQIAVADFNGDGRLDLAVANSNSTNVTLWFGMGDGSFQAGGSFSTSSGCWSVVAADFNGDGKMDLAFPIAEIGVYILLGNGDGTFGAKQIVQIPLAGSTLRIVANDFDGDGKLDLAVSDSFFNNVTILLGKGDGTFGDGISLPVGAGPFSMAVGDLNNDGKPDLVTGNIGGFPPYTVSVLLNTSQ